MNCKNCNSEVTHNYCPNCGQAAKLKRIDGHYIIHEIEHVLHFERGILYTIKELFIKPGQNIKTYFTENRSRLVKPIIFIIITSLIYTIINQFFHIEEAYMSSNGLENSTIGKSLKWTQSNYGYTNILMGGFIAIWLKLLFKKYKYNFFELLIMLCFVMGIGMLIFAFFSLIEGLTHLKLFSTSGILAILYSIWAIGSFFDKKKIGSYLKATSSYILGTITFYIMLFILAFFIDLLLKK